jgi:YidC/Oxa1 family membrane protein insertase
MLAQLPIWIALYHLVGNVAAGVPVGAMDSTLVASLGAATVLGIPLAGRGYLGGGPTHLAVVAGLAVLAAVLSYVTQKYLVAPNTLLSDAPPALVTAHQLTPVLSAVGVLVVAGAAPVALLVYWVCNSTWTLGQSAVVWRWFPTPGTAAALRRGASA